MKRIICWIKFKYWMWIFRNENNDVCCCGDNMNQHYSLDHYPLSMKEHAIRSLQERYYEQIKNKDLW